jgi:hypothetical protein
MIKGSKNLKSAAIKTAEISEISGIHLFPTKSGNAARQIDRQTEKSLNVKIYLKKKTKKCNRGGLLWFVESRVIKT